MVRQLSLIAEAEETDPARTPELFADLDWDDFPDFPVTTHDVSHLFRVRNDWLDRLKVLRAGRGSSFFPSEAQVAAFTAYLVNGQRNDCTDRLRPGSWTIPHDVAMPSDARVDFAYFPTYIAVAWLALVASEFPLVARRVRGFKAALRRGLRFSSLKKFRGHGYDANEESLEAVRLLALGKVFSYVNEHEDAASPFRQAMNHLEYDIVHRYPHENGWSSTDAFERQHALALLRGGDAQDSMVIADIHREWTDHQLRAYRDRVVATLTSRYAEAAAGALIDACAACVDTARSAFDAIRPTAVFSSRRPRAETEDLFCVELPALRGLLTEVMDRQPHREWLPRYSERQLLNCDRGELEEGIASVLQRLLRDRGGASGEDFWFTISSLVIGDTGRVWITIKATG